MRFFILREFDFVVDKIKKICYNIGCGKKHEISDVSQNHRNKDTADNAINIKSIFRGVAQLVARDVWEHAGGFRFLIFQTLENP